MTLKPCQLKSTTMHKMAGKALMMMGISFVTGVHPSIHHRCARKGTTTNGFIDSRLFAMWGVRNYTSDVWGSKQKTVQEDKKFLCSPERTSMVSEVIKNLNEVEDYRTKRYGTVFRGL